MSPDLTEGEWNVTGLSLNIAGSKRVFGTPLTHYSLKLKHTTQNLGVDKPPCWWPKHTPVTMVARNVKSETMALMDGERLGGQDERHHRPPLWAWQPWPFRQSRRFWGLFLLYLSIFEFLKLWVVSDNMYLEEEREDGMCRIAVNRDSK